jgi:hypothetical protein
MDIVSYIALAPRGLQHAFRERIRNDFNESGHSLQEIRFLGEMDSIEEKQYRKHLTNLLLKRKRQHFPNIGSVEDPLSQKLVGVGYDKTGKTMWSHAGNASAVWVQLKTNAPVHFIHQKLRCIGPLMACVYLWEDIDVSETQSLKAVKATLRSLDYPSSNLNRAIKLWHAHVQDAWPLSETELENIQRKVQGEIPIKFRLSCFRAQSKQYSYTREDFVKAIATHVSPDEWSVDLKKHDVEMVLLVKSKCLAVGLSLRPYRQLGAKCWSPGTVPPDVTPPYLTGDVLSGLVRLRPTTAQLLFHLVKMAPGDVVLDPCAGIGTIPMEVPPGVVGIGGDLILNTSALQPVAAEYSRQMRQFNSCNKSSLLAWDATSLPLRTSCVDAVVSDLPFGQKCLSSTKLDGLLPLLFGEFGRVLRPMMGCMLLLCGSFATVLDALAQLNKLQNDGMIWILPAESVLPVNIGGLAAWIIKVQRGPAEAVLVPKHLERARKLVRDRERIEKLRQHDSRKAPTTKNGRSKYRKIQS